MAISLEEASVGMQHNSDLAPDFRSSWSFRVYVYYVHTYTYVLLISQQLQGNFATSELGESAAAKSRSLASISSQASQNKTGTHSSLYLSAPSGARWIRWLISLRNTYRTQKAERYPGAPSCKSVIKWHSSRYISLPITNVPGSILVMHQGWRGWTMKKRKIALSGIRLDQAGRANFVQLNHQNSFLYFIYFFMKESSFNARARVLYNGLMISIKHIVMVYFSLTRDVTVYSIYSLHRKKYQTCELGCWLTSSILKMSIDSRSLLSRMNFMRNSAIFAFRRFLDFFDYD